MILDKKWFQNNQSLLTWMANTPYGRDLLCIPNDYSKIIRVGANHLKCELEPRKYLYDFRTHDKWAKVIRTRQKEFQFLSRYFEKEVPLISYARSYEQIQLVATSYGPWYPDAGSGGTTCDGYVSRSGVLETYSTLRTSAGNTVDVSTTNNECVNLTAGATDITWNDQRRGVFIIDTSGVNDAEIVDSGTFSLYTFDKTDGLSLSVSNSEVCLVTCTTAADNNLANGDYDIANWGTTLLASRQAYSGFSTSAYKDFTLNSSGYTAINKTGVTKFGTRFGVDFDNGTPEFAVFGQTRIRVKNADASGTTTDPKLVLTATAPSTGTMMMMGI